MKVMNLQEVTMDFANIATERTAAGLTALTASATIQIMDIPANTAVLGVWGNVLTVEGKTYTHDVGIVGTDVDGFIDNLNANALGVGAASTVFRWTNGTRMPGKSNMKMIKEKTKGKVKPADFYG